MKKSGKISVGLWVLIGVVLIIALWSVGGYNRFISLDQTVQKSWSEVESQYQRQSDLLFNFASTIKSQTGVETQFVKDVIAQRASWQNTAGSSQLARDSAGQQINAFVNAVSENYPTLQASEGYTAFRDEMAGTQNRITTARGRYIENIGAYNIATKKFPANILAGIFNFDQKEYYTSTSGTVTPQFGNGTLP